MKTYLKNRYKSFKCAFAGLKLFFLEAHFKIHLVAAVTVIAASFYFDLSKIEWLFVLSCIFLMLIAEALNTIVEAAMDRITEGFDIKIKHIKDMSAAFVLICAIYTVVVGLVIFIPKIM